MSLARGSDAELERAALAVGKNELVYRMARAKGIEVGLEQLKEQREIFAAAADSLFQVFEGADQPRRARLVDSTIRAALAGEPVRLLPTGLAQALRRRIPHGFNREALSVVVQRAPWELAPNQTGSDD
jgi:hypothetical protein